MFGSLASGRTSRSSARRYPIVAVKLPAARPAPAEAPRRDARGVHRVVGGEHRARRDHRRAGAPRRSPRTLSVRDAPALCRDDARAGDVRAGRDARRGRRPRRAGDEPDHGLRRDGGGPGRGRALGGLARSARPRRVRLPPRLPRAQRGLARKPQLARGRRPAARAGRDLPDDVGGLQPGGDGGGADGRATRCRGAPDRRDAATQAGADEADPALRRTAHPPARGRQGRVPAGDRRRASGGARPGRRVRPRRGARRPRGRLLPDGGRADRRRAAAGCARARRGPAREARRLPEAAAARHVDGRAGPDRDQHRGPRARGRARGHAGLPRRRSKAGRAWSSIPRPGSRSSPTRSSSARRPILRGPRTSSSPRHW